MLRIWHHGYHVADVGSVEEVAEVLARHGLDLSEVVEAEVGYAVAAWRARAWPSDSAAR
jgi:hypothetical protein